MEQAEWELIGAMDKYNVLSSSRPYTPKTIDEYQEIQKTVAKRNAATKLFNKEFLDKK